MNKHFRFEGTVFLCLILAAAITGMAASSSTTFFVNYSLGESVVFQVTERNNWWCGCCGSECCDTKILGWHVTDACGVWVYSVEYNVAVPASSWQGSWSQVDSSGVQVTAGSYQITVETSAGTLSRCVKIHDPCRCWCWNPCRCWSGCTCKELPSLTHCCCKVSLQLVVEGPSCCFPLFGYCSAGCP